MSLFKALPTHFLSHECYQKLSSGHQKSTFINNFEEAINLIDNVA